ncbi:MAG: hypothetical protein RL677_216 [Actinomycetota bacterium]
MEIIAIGLLILSLYFFRTILRFPNQQIEKRILTYIEYFPSNTKKLSFRLKAKKYKKALFDDDEIAEFADLLAISLVAGRGPIQALAEIEDSLDPNLRDLVRAALLRNASGISLEKSLLAMANEAKSESMLQLVRSFQTAINRGTPLAENLRTFSHELRARRKEKILLSASKKEISMLVPIVFVVLPTVLVIAIYPALQVIRNLS